MPLNRAAWIPVPRARFEVGDAPYTSPGPLEVVIKVAAVAANPLDINIQDGKYKPATPVQYPTILGSDVAGSVEEVGQNVQGLYVGQRVIGHTTGPTRGASAMSGFQHYAVVAAPFVTAIPEHIPFEKAAVLPLSVDTTTAGLFAKAGLGLALPSKDFDIKDATVLIWGGSSSIGCTAIQTAKAAGYDVMITASKANHELCKSLGASDVFDYRDPDVVEQIVAALQVRVLAGTFDCVGTRDSLEPCTDIVAQSKGSKLVMCVLTPPPDASLAKGVEVKRCFIAKLYQEEAKIAAEVHQWVTIALRDGILIPRPEPKVVGHGLESIQHAVDTLKQGVSATKIVVTL